MSIVIIEVIEIKEEELDFNCSYYVTKKIY